MHFNCKGKGTFRFTRVRHGTEGHVNWYADALLVSVGQVCAVEWTASLGAIRVQVSAPPRAKLGLCNL